MNLTRLQRLLYEIPSLVAGECSRLESMTSEFSSVEEYGKAVEVIACRLLDSLAASSPDVKNGHRQFGFIMNGLMFTALMRMTCSSQGDSSAQPVSGADVLWAPGKPNLVASLFPLDISRETHYPLHILEDRFAPQSTHSSMPGPQQTIYLSDEDRNELIAHAASIRTFDESNQRPSVHYESSFAKLVKTQPALSSRLIGLGSFGNPASSGDLIGSWLAAQRILGADSYNFYFEPTILYKRGVAVHWSALSPYSPEATILLAALGRALVRELYEQEFRALVRNDWNNSGTKQPSFLALHEAKDILAAQDATLSSLELCHLAGEVPELHEYIGEARSQVSLMRKLLFELNSVGNPGSLAVWRTNPRQIANLCRSLLAPYEEEQCILAYMDSDFKFEDGFGFLYVYPEDLCQLAGPPEDLATAIAGIARNAIHARSENPMWDEATLESLAARCSARGMRLRRDKTSPTALISIWAESGQLRVSVVDGGPGIHNNIVSEIFRTAPSESGPTTKVSGGMGIKQACILIRNRFRGEARYHRSPSCWDFHIPLIPWLNRRRTEKF